MRAKWILNSCFRYCLWVWFCHHVSMPVIIWDMSQTIQIKQCHYPKMQMINFKCYMIRLMGLGFRCSYFIWTVFMDIYYANASYVSHLIRCSYLLLSTKKKALKEGFFWRRGRDSNPRYRCRHT